MNVPDFAFKTILLLLTGIGFSESPEIHAESDRLWTGVAVSSDGRVCVCFPRWSADNPVSLGELIGDELVPVACKYCSDKYSVSEALQNLGCGIEYVGVLISDAIKDGYVPMVW